MKTFTLSFLVFLSIQVNSLFAQVDSTRTDSISVVSERINEDVNQPVNNEVYKVKNGIDIPLTVAMAGYTLYGFSVVYGRDKVPEAEILALNRNDVNSFDRPIIDNYSTKAKSASDVFFYGSMPLPLFLLLDKEIRKDGPKVGLLYLEALSLTGSIYVSASMIANRFRPYAYNPNVDMDTRRRGGARNSFPAGHPAVTATSLFFMAKVYSDYHPDMKNKWILYSLAGAGAAACGIFRIEAGQHFITDVLVGVPMGALVGILVPHIHKVRNKNPKLSLIPKFNKESTGFIAYYRLGK